MTEMVTSGSMSGERKRSDGPFGESGLERRRSRSAPPVLHATAPFLDSTTKRMFVCDRTVSCDLVCCGTWHGLSQRNVPRETRSAEPVAALEHVLARSPLPVGREDVVVRHCSRVYSIHRSSSIT